MKKRHVLATIGALTVATGAAAVAYSANKIAKKMKPYAKKYRFTGDKIVYDEEFDTDSLAVSFGGLAIDMRNATLKDDFGTIKIYGHFSGIDIVVPDDWNVKTIGTKKNASISNLAEESTGDDKPTLIIKHDIHFSGLSIRRESSIKDAKDDIMEMTEEAKETVEEIAKDH